MATDAEPLVPPDFAALNYSNSESPETMLPSGSSLGQDSISYMSEDETEYSTDEMDNSFGSLDVSNTERIEEASDLLQPILLPFKHKIFYLVMRVFWKTF